MIVSKNLNYVEKKLIFDLFRIILEYKFNHKLKLEKSLEF